MDFVEHREYQQGDDVRFLDRHVYARLGQRVVRQYSAHEQAIVTVLVDVSASMRGRDDAKLMRAYQLASCMAHMGIAAGDEVRVATVDGDGAEWYREGSRVHASQRLLAWLTSLPANGGTNFEATARLTRPRLEWGGTLVIISDFLGPGLSEAVRLWRAVDQDLIAVHVLAPEDVDPSHLGEGSARLEDRETGRSLDVSLDAATIAQYAQHYRAWSSEVTEEFLKRGGRYAFCRSDEELEHTVLLKWRQSGFIT